MLVGGLVLNAGRGRARVAGGLFGGEGEGEGEEGRAARDSALASLMGGEDAEEDIFMGAGRLFK